MVRVIPGLGIIERRVGIDALVERFMKLPLGDLMNRAGERDLIAFERRALLEAHPDFVGCGHAYETAKPAAWSTLSWLSRVRKQLTVPPVSAAVATMKFTPM